MRSPERHRTVALCLAIGAVLAGCANQANSASSQPTAITETPAVSMNPYPGRDDTPPTRASSAPPVTPPTEAQATSTETVTVTVDGGEIPAALVDGYAHNGGDLIDPVEWKGRFGQAPLPELSGPGVRLVEGLRRMELLDGQWERTDEAGWLAMSSQDRDSMMDSLRDAAGIVGVASTTTSTDQGADCVIDTYEPDSNGVSWQVQGCSYDKFPRLLSLGVSRTGPTDDPPVLIDPTIATVADTIGGSVTFVEARLGEPGADGSTLRLSAQLDSDLGFDPASAAVSAGPLAGWQTFPGEGSLLLSGPTGATWTLSAGVAVFTWSGRW